MTLCLHDLPDPGDLVAVATLGTTATVIVHRDATLGDVKRETNRCRECGRAWTASREAHCPGCHRQFSSDSAFESHQVLDHGQCAQHPKNQGRQHRVCDARSVCRDPATLRRQNGSPRLVLSESRFGPVWGWPAAPSGEWAEKRWPQRHEVRAAPSSGITPGGAAASLAALWPSPAGDQRGGARR